MDAEVATLEAYGGGSNTKRTIEIDDSGPPLEPMPTLPSSGRVAVAFSSGKDSLTQVAMLTELGEHPILVTTTAPGPFVDHIATRRRHVLREIVRRRPVELIEVESDLRAQWANGFAASRYHVGVSEVSDTFLYFAATLVAGAATGASHLLLASETEIQENAVRR